MAKEINTITLETRRKTIYLAGPISNNPHAKYDFSCAENLIKLTKKDGANTVILNPATLPEGMTRKQYMRICFAMIDSADEVHFLRGWETSAGATAEHGYCEYIRKPITYL